jgi:predicted amidohydrolase
VFPYWSEFDVTPPVAVGTSVPVFDTDRGRVAISTCFDVNFPEVWQRLADQDVELVIWPSAYSAGTSLPAHAQPSLSHRDLHDGQRRRRE